MVDEVLTKEDLAQSLDGASVPVRGTVCAYLGLLPSNSAAVRLLALSSSLLGCLPVLNPGVEYQKTFTNGAILPQCSNRQGMPRNQSGVFQA